MTGESRSARRVADGLGERILGSDGTIEHTWGESDMVKGESGRKTPNASVDIGYRSAIAVHMANLAYRQAQRVTLESARSITPDFESYF